MQKNKGKKLKKKILNSRFYFLDSRFYILDSGRRGFTIVELLVSIGLFGVIVSIAMGGFVRALHTQRQIVALISANSNVSLVIEQIAREMRTGYDFCPDAPPACSPSSLSFTNARGESVTYAYGTADDVRGNSHGVITRLVGAGTADQVTAENVNIRYLNFTRLLNAFFPERITINIGLSPATAAAPVVSENVTNIQTTVSARSFAG